MNVIETITVRLHDLKNISVVKSALGHVPTTVASAPIRIDLFQNANVQNDWHVQILRPAGSDITAKSPFAISLAESFRPIGMVHHSVLIPVPLPSDQSKADQTNENQRNNMTNQRRFDHFFMYEEERR